MQTTFFGLATCGALVAGVSLAACDDSVGRYDSYIEPTPIDVQAHGDAWLLRIAGSDDVFVVRRSGEAVEFERLAIERPVRALTPLNDGRLLTLDAEEPTLFVLREGQGAAVEVEMPTTYDRIVVSDDERFAIASFSQGSSGPPGSILFNPNSIAIIELGAELPTVREVRLAGPRPSWIGFSPELTFADPGDPRVFAVVAGASALSLVDLTTTNVADQQRLIRLADPASSATVTPITVQFSQDDPTDPNDVFAFVLAGGASEIFAINLLPADPATGRMLQPAINQLAVSGPPQTMSPFEVDGVPKLLVTHAGNPSLAIIDVATGAVTSVATDRVLSYAFTYELDPAGGRRPEAILYRNGDSVVFFADLATIERQGSGALRARPIAGRVDGVFGVEGAPGSRQRAIVRYANGAGLSVLDLALRSETPVPAQLTLGDFAVSGDRFYTVVSQASRMAILGLGDSVASIEVDLPAPGVRVVPLPSSNAVLVTHAGNGGWFSVLGLDTLDEGPLAEFRGVVLEGYLDRNDGDAP